MSDIDSDLKHCLIHNPQSEVTEDGLTQAGFDLDDITRVHAVWEGENDGDAWRWVLSLKDGRFVYLNGSCDYTGWDCQSWAHNYVAETPELAAMMDDVEEVQDDLLRQIE